mgnify:CR=1 FL=1
MRNVYGPSNHTRGVSGRIAPIKWGRKYQLFHTNKHDLERTTPTYQNEVEQVEKWMMRKEFEWKIKGRIAPDGHIKIDPDEKRKPWTVEAILKAFKGMTEEDARQLLFDIEEVSALPLMDEPRDLLPVQCEVYQPQAVA